MGLAFMCGVTRRGPGWVLQLVSTARIWNAGGNCTTWGFDTPATRRDGASNAAKPPTCGTWGAGGCGLVRHGQCRVVVARSGGFLGSI